MRSKTALGTKRLLGAATLLLAACSEGGGYRELGEPITLDDGLPLPAPVTRENARLVVRRCLQAHRQSSSTPEADTSYAFSESGFVQLIHARTLDRSEERVSRIYVAFAAIRSVKAESMFNVTRLRTEYRVVLEGTFRRWEAPVRAFRTLPELGQEPAKAEVPSLILTFDEAPTAKRLSEALSLLATRP
ncbi:MAG TPA: hypothetical protein VEN81_00260 [Planctomycetota bacterium]|nr:hypothetical protein [Planctomycetota bacterium]